jgi:hypothetical protein
MAWQRGKNKNSGINGVMKSKQGMAWQAMAYGSVMAWRHQSESVMASA